jgi:hypothetical protein
MAKFELLSQNFQRGQSKTKKQLNVEDGLRAVVSTQVSRTRRRNEAHSNAEEAVVA